MRFLPVEQACFSCGRNTNIPSAKKALHNRWNTASSLVLGKAIICFLKKKYSISSAANLHLKCVVLASLFIGGVVPVDKIDELRFSNFIQILLRLT